MVGWVWEDCECCDLGRVIDGATADVGCVLYGCRGGPMMGLGGGMLLGSMLF